MVGGPKPRRSRVRALISAGVDWTGETERAEQTIIRSITFLSVGVVGAICGALMLLAGMKFLFVIGMVVAAASFAAFLLSSRGHERGGTLLMVAAINVTFVLAVASRGSGELEVIHVFPLSLPFTLFRSRERVALGLSVGMALAGVLIARLPLLPPPEPTSLETATLVRLIATFGIALIVGAQLLALFYIRNDTLRTLEQTLALAEGANAARSAFLANISHEVRTPMNGVLGMLGLLRDAPIETDQRELVDGAYASATTLLSVIDGILDPSAFEAGRAPIPAAEPHDEAPAPSAPLRVLVVDDNLINLKVAERMLRHLGCDVDVADSGREAVERTSAVPYALVFMDIQMPQMDGMQATALIRQREHEQGGEHHLPIVALTAHAMAGDRERYLAAGMDDYLSKPAKREQLGSVLARFSIPTPTDHVVMS